MKEERKSEIERLGSLFEDLSPELERKVVAKMTIAAKIDEARKRLNLGKRDLANKFKKSPSEITKWLSGNHNFTIDTLIDIERILDIKLLTVDEKSEYGVDQYIKKPERFIFGDAITDRFLNYDKKLPILSPSEQMIFDQPIKLNNFVEHDKK